MDNATATAATIRPEEGGETVNAKTVAAIVAPLLLLLVRLFFVAIVRPPQRGGERR